MNKRHRKPIANVLVVDDDAAIVSTLILALESWKYEAAGAGSIAQAREALDAHEPQVVLLDIELPDGSGMDFLEEIKDAHPDIVVVMVTGNVDVQSTVAAMRGGAHDFIAKPIHLEELRVTLRNSVETVRLRREVRHMRSRRSAEFGFEQIIGSSSAMRKTIETSRKIAASEVAAILLQGETGTGKELFAKAIHQASDRREMPFFAINCAALPATLIESELFGYEKGAFTDAKNRKEGLFEQADGGTLFLDEIGEMDVSLQAKLLRVLEEGKFRRIGGLKEIPVDVRVLAASNRNLKEESVAERFRLDLYYRLSVVQIDIPPLRERGTDVIELAHFYIEQTNQRRHDGRKLTGLSPKVERLFMAYDWTGNVRELRNVIERASILEDSDLVTTEHLPADLVYGKGAGFSDSGFVLPAEGIPLASVELELVKQAMERTGGNLTKAAKLLDISRDQVRYRLKKEDPAVRAAGENG